MENNKSRAVGRPREFDETEVLTRLMDSFWENGFDGTSLSELVSVSGVQKASLYAAFGDKQAIYLKALSLYDRRLLDMIASVLGDKRKTARRRFSSLFRTGITRAAAGDRSGCFLCSAAADRAELDAETGKIVRRDLRKLENIFSDALGGLYDSAEQQQLAARHLLAVYVGLQSLARAGYPVRSLESIVTQAVGDIPNPAAERAH